MTTRLSIEERLARLGVKPADLHETFTRSGGHGGQNVNKVSTAVQLTHLPTGLTVRCETGRPVPVLKVPPSTIPDPMDPRTPTHTIKAKIWLYQGPAAWHFVTLPRKAGGQIRRDYGVVARGWGSIPVTVKIGRTEWKTSLFPDKKSKSYLLPLSAAVRKAEHLSAGSVVKVRIDVRWRELG